MFECFSRSRSPGHWFQSQGFLPAKIGGKRIAGGERVSGNDIHSAGDQVSGDGTGPSESCVRRCGHHSRSTDDEQKNRGAIQAVIPFLSCFSLSCHVSFFLMVFFSFL